MAILGHSTSYQRGRKRSYDVLETAYASFTSSDDSIRSSRSNICALSVTLSHLMYVPSTRDNLPIPPSPESANTFQIQSKRSQISRPSHPVTNHNSRIRGALTRSPPRKAPAVIPCTKTASLASPMGRDPRGFARRKLFLRTMGGLRGRKVTVFRS